MDGRKEGIKGNKRKEYNERIKEERNKRRKEGRKNGRTEGRMDGMEGRGIIKEGKKE